MSNAPKFDLSAFQDDEGEEPKPTARTARGQGVKRRKGPKFARVELTKAARAAKATGDPLLVVWPLLLYLAWQGETSMVTLSNEALVPYGVDRFAKYRALRRLTRAGLVHVERCGKKASTVTLLDD